MIAEPIRILHVTEAMGGGIVTVLESFAKRQKEEGAEVTIYYLERPESPSKVDLHKRFRGRAMLVSFTSERGKLVDYLRLGKRLVQAQRNAEFDVIHLHSSKAGVFGRLAQIFAVSRRTDVFYSPHGFAFLREDVPRLVSYAMLNVERILARFGCDLILTSPSEHHLARAMLRTKRTHAVDTGVDENSIPPYMALKKLAHNNKPKVGIVARVTYQKAPWRFAAVAAALETEADFVWIGGGDTADEERWLGNNKTTGWLPPQDLSAAIDDLDIFLFPTLWEGMPLSLIQAQAAGIPAVVSDVVGNRDAVVDGHTGYVCETDEELLLRTRDLVRDHELRTKMSDAAREWARRGLTDRDLGKQSIAIYTSKAGSRG